jgi:hypothetical protein
LGDAVVPGSGRAVSVLQSAEADEFGQQRIDVASVGSSAAEFGGQGRGTRVR